MAITREFTYETQAEYDGTLGGLVDAVRTVVEEARADGVPDTVNYAYISVSPVYGREARLHRLTFSTRWSPPWALPDVVES